MYIPSKYVYLLMSLPVKIIIALVILGSRILIMHILKPETFARSFKVNQCLLSITGTKEIITIKLEIASHEQ